MNRRAISKISVIFFSLVFLILWALFFANQLTTWGQVAIVNGNLSGIEAFFYGNLNLVVGVLFFIFILAFAIYGGD